MRYEAKWLPGGSVELAQMPLAGDREMRKLTDDDIRLEVTLRRKDFVVFCDGLLAAKRILDTLGPAKAKESWDAFLVRNYPADAKWLDWPVEQFASSLKENIDLYIHQQLTATDAEDAQRRIEEESRSVNKELESFSTDVVERLAMKPLIQLWWRLGASGVKTIITPAGPKPISWGDEKRDEALALLAKVVDKGDLERLHERPNRPPDARDRKPPTEAEVRGNSNPPSGPSTPSRPGSPPSSAPTTGTTEALAA